MTHQHAREIAIMKNTIDTITDEQIEALRSEAGVADDQKQIAICDRALDGDDAARAECVRVIREGAQS